MASLLVPNEDELATYPSLGPQVVAFIERYAVFGPGDREGEPAEVDDEKRALIDAFYSLYPMGHPRAGRRVFRRCSIEVRKGLAKTELAGWVAFAEFHQFGPVRFGGFDAEGALLPGIPVKSPYVPMLATGEDQSSSLGFAVVRFIAQNCDTTSLFNITTDKISRVGEDTSYVEAVANTPGGNDGARTTFAHFDEPHWLVLPRDRKSVVTMLLNLGKRRYADPWCLSTSTAGTPGMGSVEEDWWREANEIHNGKRKNDAVFCFIRWAAGVYDLTTTEGRIAALKESTGQQGEWACNFEEIADLYDAVEDKAQWERVYLNSWRRSTSAAYDIIKARALIQPGEKLDKGAFVTLGFDGSRFEDATGIVATEIETGRQQLIACWEKPDDVKGWEVPVEEVDAVIRSCFKEFTVYRLYCDVYPFGEWIAKWSGEFQGKVIEFRTNNNQRKMCEVARLYFEAIESGEVSYVGEDESLNTLMRHIACAGRKDTKLPPDDQGVIYQLHKLDNLPQNKFDAAMAAVISWYARVEAKRDGAHAPSSGTPKLLYGGVYYGGGGF